MGRPARLPPEVVEEAARLRRAHLSYRQIAEQLRREGLTSDRLDGRVRPVRIDPAVIRRALERKAAS